MATQTGTRPGSKGPGFLIHGTVVLEGKEACSDDLPLRAFVFDERGGALGVSEVSTGGRFSVAVELKEPAQVEVLVGPAVEAAQVRLAQPPSQRFTAKDWTRGETGFTLSPAFTLAKALWWPWWPIRVCVRGRVRKSQAIGDPCPVPFSTVEVYDVDREGCLWPYLEPRLPSLVDKAVVRVPDLMRPPVPDPIGPVVRPDAPHPRGVAATGPAGMSEVALNPQPLPPKARALTSLAAQAPAVRDLSGRVGEMAQVQASIAAGLAGLTVTSRVAPWQLWPRCFYSRAVVCTTTTDCDGRFTCCFRWWPFHVRNGRLRFDARPDLVIKVTQVIDGVSRVVYLDPYTSTRWDSWGAYIDLVLDDEDVVCGSGCSPQPEGTSTFFARVGNDEVFQIDQASGVYDLTRPGLGGTIDNMAYGAALNLHAIFGDALAGAAPQRYYRLSINGPTTSGAWKDIKTTLSDTRVHKVTHLSESFELGPFTVGATSNLYKVRDTATYDWYNRDWIGTWYTHWAGDAETFVPDEGLYTVRLEVFDEAGVRLTSASVEYLDGTAVPPAVLPPMVDGCYLVLQVDNRPATAALAFPAVVNDCGVVPMTAAPFDITVNVNQENGRLHSWSVGYVKGLNVASGTLGSAGSDTGLAVPVNTPVSSTPMTAGLTGTCAFSLTISAWAHIRNGYGLVYLTTQHYALAVDACQCP